MYSRDNFLDGFESTAASEYSEQARALAEQIRQISAALIRIDTDAATLQGWQQKLAAVASDMQQHSQRDAKEINRRLFKGEAGLQDVYDIFDYDPSTGFANPLAPKIEFLDYGDVVKARVSCTRQYQGPPNRVHGGTIAVIFDGLLSRVQQLKASNGVTGTISVRFHGATPINSELQLTAWVDHIDGRKTFLKAEMHAGGELTASAEGVWISTKPRE